MGRSSGLGPAGWRRLLPNRRRGWLWVGLTFGILLNGLRLRQRLSALGRIPQATGGPRPDPDGGAQDDGFLVVHLPEVVVDDDTRREAIAHARDQGLEVLDLVPGDLSPEQSLDLARGVDTATYRTAAFVTGRGALHALAVSREVWGRAFPNGDALPDPDPDPDAGDAGDGGRAGQIRDRADMVRLTERLKQYAVGSTDLAVAPELHCVGASTDERRLELGAIYGAVLPAALGIPAARSALLITGFALSPGWGAAAMAAYLLQPALVTAGGALGARPPSPVRDAVGRIVQPLALVRAALAPSPIGDSDTDDEDPIEARRPAYQAALAGGLERFFEPRRQSCPWCAGTELVERLRTGDLSQFKPGEFIVEECTSCGLLFQNPRLSIDGLDFYYRDFYDGLGAGGTQVLFAYNEPAYRERVAMARRHTSPEAWLDVGTGYGHFCATARALLPETNFGGLDMGSGVDEAQRRGWIDRSYRGLFPDLAGELKGAYDVVSMHHYLEHTRDPKAELDAARTVLRPGGHLLIEVPDPESRFARVLGRYWLPWFQPQHLQFVSAGNLCTELEAQGFSVVEIERGPVHQPVDLGAAMWAWAQARAPKPRVPRRDPPSVSHRIERAVILGAMAPFVLLGVLADRGLKKLINTRAQRWSNTYRVLARREP